MNYLLNRALLIGLTLLMSPSSVFAEARMLTGAEIKSLLPEIIATGDGTKQTFSQNGSTTYTDRGNLSQGKWWVSGEQYCSSWPPTNFSACYDVSIEDTGNGETLLIWIDQSGGQTINRFSEAK